MSRAALWKQQSKVREREDRAASVFEAALDEGRARARRQSSSIVPLWGPDDGTFHFHPVLHQNVLASPYFQRCCETLADWSSVVDEIYEQDLQHVQPFSDRQSPSTAFCLLLRLLLLRLTAKELRDTLDHPDSPYIRALGFLYVRYSCPPESVLGWIAPYLLDDQELRVEIGGGDGRRGPSATAVQTVGGFVRMLFGGEGDRPGRPSAQHPRHPSDREYYGTPLPRYPTAVEREIRAHVLQHDRIRRRAVRHAGDPAAMRELGAVGRRVWALYGDEDNPPEWYEAVVDRVICQDPSTGRRLAHPRFVVTFPEYGNTETVSLGELDVLREGRDPGRESDGGRPAPPARGAAGGGRGGGGLYDEVARRERESAAAPGRSGRGASRRPPTAKEALSAASRHAVPDRDDGQDDGDEGRGRRPRGGGNEPPHGAGRGGDSPEAPRKREGATAAIPPEELAAREEKRRRLLARYG
jgi:pre-mRNA-splicing factor 38B